MRLVITGAHGQLGGELATRARDHSTTVTAFGRTDCDVTDPAAVAWMLDRYTPDALVNCAAWTDVDAAEAHPERAFLANATGPRILADACARRGVLLVHLSTDYVFDGTAAEPLDEDASPCPLSVYGASKLAGEREVRARASRHLIVRTSGLYGRDGPNFVLKLLRRAASGVEPKVVTDQVTSPTWSAHLAKALLRLVTDNATGTYHLTNTGSVSWYDFAVAALGLAGSCTAVQPITTELLGAPARRPEHSVLDNRAWRCAGQPPLAPWEDALAGYISELRARGWLPIPLSQAARA